MKWLETVLLEESSADLWTELNCPAHDESAHESDEGPASSLGLWPPAGIGNNVRFSGPLSRRRSCGMHLPTDAESGPVKSLLAAAFPS